jgi:hypothetical protein
VLLGRRTVLAFAPTFIFCFHSECIHFIDNLERIGILVGWRKWARESFSVAEARSDRPVQSHGSISIGSNARG